MKGASVIGFKFGLLTVIEEAKKRGNIRAVVCQCDCGNSKTVLLGNLRSKKTLSCGCLHKLSVKNSNSSHRLTGTREYITWSNMKARCINPSRKDWGNYGGRGISVCKEWADSFEVFLSDMGDKPLGFSLDRINVDGDYTPSNCQWASATQQANNTRANRLISIDGMTQTLAQACLSRSLNYKTVHKRLRDGWTIEKALSNLSTTA